MTTHVVQLPPIEGTEPIYRSFWLNEKTNTMVIIDQVGYTEIVNPYPGEVKSTHKFLTGYWLNTGGK